MPRVELLTQVDAPLTAQQFYAGGDPGPIVAALANVPELLGPTLAFVGAALGDGCVGARYKEFAVLRTSALQGCSYCVHAHTTVALGAGLSPREVRALRGELAVNDVFAEQRERALIAWIDAVAGGTGPVPDPAWTTARAHWPEHELVELTVTIGATMFLNRFATGLQLPTPGDALAEGAGGPR